MERCAADSIEGAMEDCSELSDTSWRDGEAQLSSRSRSRSPICLGSGEYPGNVAKTSEYRH